MYYSARQTGYCNWGCSFKKESKRKLEGKSLQVTTTGTINGALRRRCKFCLLAFPRALQKFGFYSARPSKGEKIRTLKAVDAHPLACFEVNLNCNFEHLSSFNCDYQRITSYWKSVRRISEYHGYQRCNKRISRESHWLENKKNFKNGWKQPFRPNPTAGYHGYQPDISRISRPFVYRISWVVTPWWLPLAIACEAVLIFYLSSHFRLFAYSRFVQGYFLTSAVSLILKALENIDQSESIAI